MAKQHPSLRQNEDIAPEEDKNVDADEDDSSEGDYNFVVLAYI